jgi:hypothetical protein
MIGVTAEHTTVYTEPNDQSTVVGGLQRQAIAVVLDQQGDWTRVPVGWLRSADVVELSQPWIGEATEAATVYSKPNAASDARRQVDTDALLLVTGVTHGVDGDTSLWWATTEGYVGLNMVRQVTGDKARDWKLPRAEDASAGWWGEMRPANVRAGPTREAGLLGEFRGGERVKVLSSRSGEDVEGDSTWHRIDGGRYPGGFVHASLVERIPEAVPSVAPPPSDRTLGDQPWLVVDRAAHTLTVLRAGQPVFATYVSLGKAGKDTPAGAYSTYLKYSADRMTSTSVPDAERSYSLPNVPFVQYFKDDGSAIHGTYWHDGFGTDESQGCINITWSDSAYVFQQTMPQLASDQFRAIAGVAEATPLVIIN